MYYINLPKTYYKQGVKKLLPIGVIIQIVVGILAGGKSWWILLTIPLALLGLVCIVVASMAIEHLDARNKLIHWSKGGHQNFLQEMAQYFDIKQGDDVEK